MREAPQSMQCVSTYQSPAHDEVGHKAISRPASKVRAIGVETERLGMERWKRCMTVLLAVRRAPGARRSVRLHAETLSDSSFRNGRSIPTGNPALDIYDKLSYHYDSLS